MPASGLTEVVRQGPTVPSQVSKPMAPTYLNHGLSYSRAKQLCPCLATAPELTSPNDLPSYKALNLIVVPQVILTMPGSSGGDLLFCAVVRSSQISVGVIPDGYRFTDQTIMTNG
jgi:hypothetical protein